MRGICRRKRSPEGATTFQSSPPHLARARIGKAGLRRLFEALCGLGAQGSPNYFNLSCIITRLRKSGCPCDGSAKHLRTASHLVGEMLLAFKWTTRASCRNVVFSGPCEGSQSRRWLREAADLTVLDIPRARGGGSGRLAFSTRRATGSQDSVGGAALPENRLQGALGI